MSNTVGKTPIPGNLSVLGMLFPTFLGTRIPGPILTSGTGTLKKAINLLAKPISFQGHRAAVTTTTAADVIQGGRSTLTGTPSTSSPTIYATNRITQVYDRRQIILDLWQIYYSNAEFKRAIWMRARQAVSGSFRFKCEPRKGVSALKAKQCQDRIDRYLRRVGLVLEDDSWDLDQIAAWLVQALLTGDFFQQRVIRWNDPGGEEAGEIQSLLTMPSESMERLTDLSDQFYDSNRAFVQMDINTQQVIVGSDGRPAEFNILQIYHDRWERLGTDRYGNSAFLQCREGARSLDVLEKSQEVRRMTAHRVETHTLGDSENPEEWKDVDEYKRQNGLLNIAAEVAADPYHQIARYYSNGRASYGVIPGDPNVHQIDDIVYKREAVTAGYGVPAPLMGLSLTEVQRDLLDTIRAHWIDERAPEETFVIKAILAGVRLEMRLGGFNPAAFKISLRTPRPTMLSPVEKANFVKTLSQNTAGAGMSARALPIGTIEQWLTILAPELGITDPDDIKATMEDMREELHIDADTSYEMQLSGQQPAGGGAGVGSANSKNSGGGATTGYGKRFEGGTAKNPRESSPGEGYKSQG